ncbi:TetR/AcrR family transcriptional regulator [Maritimibacter sp. DP1N21-5]|uniref:TetR/AcrR family transcriptional regulator n=1 Tax=Maritimibacter sp. DP1N21-5 TaxID=2836867 RepID=UPI001C48DABF|nr:TetR/AcrR family transcriptional regulator [Maritimibacter sp. DP1N21-5]MBV7410799.1 TetR/AcrR family transcriptional regulator [Maritimibacter sp. DP1N21-5]
MSQDAPPRRGRPPSKAARAKALAAARAILAEDGFAKLTVEAVAARAGVGKPTIYRNWANKSELAMAALLPDAPDERGDQPPLPFEAALREQLRRLVASFAKGRGRQMAFALASSDPESELARAFRNRVILASREAGRAMILSAVGRGELALPCDMEITLDMIYAPVLYRVLGGHQPLDGDFADGLAAEACRLLS